MKKENLIKKGNESIAVGVLWGLGAAASCPCPICLLSSSALILNGIREKLLP